MTVGHLKEIIQHLPDDMLAMVPIGIGSDSLVVPVCNKSRVRKIHVDETDHIETVLMLEPCVCGLQIIEDSEEIAHDLIVNPAIDN